MAELEYEGVFTYVDGDGNTTKLYPDVKTDKTLSVSDKAADAASVGEAFSDTVAWNLIPYPYIQTTYTKNGIVWTDNGNGTVTANGTNTGASNTVSTFKLAYCSAADDKKLYLEPGEYTMYGCPAGGGTSTWRIRFGGGTSATFIGHDIGDGYTFTLTERTLFDADLQVYGGVTVNNLVFKPMLVKGSHPRKLESSYQYLHKLLGPNADGGSSAEGVRYVTDETDPNCHYVQLQKADGTWANWRKVYLDVSRLYVDGYNGGEFEAFAGTAVAGYATTAIKPNTDFDDDVKVWFNSPVNDVGLRQGVIISKAIDLTYYNTLILYHKSSYNYQNDNTYVRLFITKTKETGMTPIASINLMPPGVQPMNREGDITLDISTIAGECYIGVMVSLNAVANVDITVQTTINDFKLL